MNGFANHGLDEDAFGEKKGNIVQAFDAFPKARPQYVTQTSGGGKWTVAMLTVSVLLIFTEFARWWRGYETHTFEVEKGVGHILQINLDIVISMSCDDIHVNVQDAAGDRILAAQMLKLNPTTWKQWVNNKGMHGLNKDSQGRLITGEGWHDYDDDEGFGEEHVHDIISSAGYGRGKFAKTPRLKGPADSCRIFGSLEVNKVQGDFHITARGHGYQEWGAAHLDHNVFNFSHIVNELSFGEFYPTLLNPLDRTVSGTVNHFHKFQYFLSIVPTFYQVVSSYGSNAVFTNQYAVTEQSHIVGERNVPGIFFKYDIEPMMLTIEERRDGFLKFVVKIVNVVSGVLVAGHWGHTLSDWAMSVWGRRRRRKSEGVLNGRAHENLD